jgi:anti-sigma B factor antagonist
MALSVEQELHGDRQILVVDGELDLVTAPALTSAALALADAGERDIIVDARKLEFCDSSGLTAFVRIANRLDPDGRLAIAAPNPLVQRVLEVSGLVEAFVVVGSVPAAIEHLDASAPA